MGLTRRLVRPLCVCLALASLLGCAGTRTGQEPAGAAAPAVSPAQTGQVEAAPQAPAPKSMTPGNVIDGDGRILDKDGFVARASEVSYVLLGEEHTNVCDHLAQADLIEAMATAGISLAVGMEMIAVDQQPVLDRFNAGELSASDLETALNWSETWGFPFSLYAPIFLTAQRHGLPVYALNAPRELVRKAGHEGLEALSPAERAMLPATVYGPTAEQENELKEFFASHHQMMEMAEPTPRPKTASWQSFIFTQSLWDTQMAERAVRVHRDTDRTVAIVAGVGHVERGWGIKRRLDILDEGSKSLVIVPFRGGADAAGGLDSREGDLFFFCPPTQASRLGFTTEMREDGAHVIAVQDGSRADKAGLKAGDIVAEAGGEKVESLWTLHQASLKALKEKHDLELGVIRSGVELTIKVNMRLPSGTERPGAGAS